MKIMGQKPGKALPYVDLVYFFFLRKEKHKYNPCFLEGTLDEEAWDRVQENIE